MLLDSTLRFTMIGSVDDGKSTLIGRLLHDHGAVYDDQLESIRSSSKGTVDFALITDGLKLEREQGITIDVAYRYFSSSGRRFIVADTPGHEQYTRNMITGASTADAAVVLVDVTKGVLSQTRRHAYLSWMLGIRQLCIAINKMDVIGYQRYGFDQVCSDWAGISAAIPGCDCTFIPVSALRGDNVVVRSKQMSWYQGPSLLEYLESVEAGSFGISTWLRFPVQLVLRATNSERRFAGRVFGGSIRVGDEIVCLPSDRRARINSISAPDDDAHEASVPISVSISIDQHIDISRGDMIGAADHPPAVSSRFESTLFWIDDAPLTHAYRYSLKHTTKLVGAEITKVFGRLDIDRLELTDPGAIRVNDIARVEIETRQSLFCDRYTENRHTGSFILIDPATQHTVAAGVIERIFTDRLRGHITFSERRGAVVWLTGLSSAGKTTIAAALGERIRATGVRVEMLDGDAVRQRLCRDLGFSKRDRDENIRRLGFVAEMLAKHGIIVVVAAISPYRAARDELRREIPGFIEVYVNAPLDVCERRDVKGLYHKARAGTLCNFSGINDPYEAPLQPEIECRTDQETPDESVSKIFEWLQTTLWAIT
jgi:bifunctional enzyme CysN/CysC